MRDDLPKILAVKTWITENEGTDVTKKLEEIRQWFSSQIMAQEKVGLNTEPVITMAEVTKRIETFSKFYKRITDKKKPILKTEEKTEDKKEEKTEESKEGEPKEGASQESADL